MKSISDNIITFDATLCITIQNEDFVLDNQNLISQLTPLLSSLYNPSTGKYILPSDITNTSFEQFLNILNHYNDTPFINSLSLSALVNVVNIAILLKSHKIVELLTLNAKGRISLQSIIDIIIAFYPIKEKHIAIMNNVISPSIEFVIRNINAIKNEINLLPSSAVDAIAEEFLKKNEDKELEQFFIDAMMTSRKITNNNIYDLLEIERKKIANDFEQYHKRNRDKIDFVWKIKSDDITEGIFREENVLIENLSLTLISYYEYSCDTFHLAMQMKNDINNFASTNSIVFTGENEATIDAKDNEVISLLSICEIPEINFKSKINFNCVYYNIKSKVLIYKISNFKYKFNNANSFNFTLNIFFNRNFLFPSLLNHISTNFSLYSSLPSINILPKVVLMLILNNTNLCYNKEDDILIAVLNWLSNKDIAKLSSYSDIFAVLKWNFVSIESIAKMLTVYSKISKSVDHLIEVLSTEINRRAKEPSFMKDLVTCIVNSSDVQIANKSLCNNTNSNVSSNFTSNYEINYDTRSNNTSNTYLIKVSNSRRTPSSNRNIKLSTTSSSLSKKNCLRKKGYRNTSPVIDKGKNNSVDDKAGTSQVLTKVKKLYSKYRNVYNGEKSLSTYMKNKSNSSSFTKQSEDVVPIRKYNVNSMSSQRNEIVKTETNKIPFNAKKINKSSVRHHPRSKSNY